MAVESDPEFVITQEDLQRATSPDAKASPTRDRIVILGRRGAGKDDLG